MKLGETVVEICRHALLEGREEAELEGQKIALTRT
jgi:hypothetical protein